jgi:hypothetical protein
VARLGGDYYCRVQGDSIFKIHKPLEKIGIGIDQIPEHIRKSRILTGNDLGLLGNVENLPDKYSIDEFMNRPEVKAALQKGEQALHLLAHQFLQEERVEDAWKILLSYQG